MSQNVISVLSSPSPSGISNHQFRQLDSVYMRAAQARVLQYRSVSCDFEKGIFALELSKSPSFSPFIGFFAKKVGPKTTMYELYIEGRGRVAKSALFERVFARYAEEVKELINQAE